MKRIFGCVLAVSAALLPALCYGQVKLILTPEGPKDVSEKAKEKDKQQPRDQPQLFRVSLSPAAEPDPALKYSLYPEYLQLKPGNAAPYYYRALLSFAEWSDRRDRAFYEKYDKWMEMPPAELPKKDVREELRPFHRAWQQLLVAAYREECDWNWRIQDLDGMESIAFLLQEIQDSRGLARYLALKARLEIGEGKHDEALQTLRVGYRLGHDVAQPPILITKLVGVAIASIMNDQLIELISAADAPNLYWAIAQLPQPLVDMRPAMEYEKSLPVKLFPFLADAETVERTPEQWRELLVESVENLNTAVGNTRIPVLGEVDNSGKGKLKSRLAATALVIAGYPRAKQGLAEFGYTKEQIDAMPVGQVVAVYQSRIYRRMYDEMFKWNYLPLQQAIRGMEKSDEKLHREGYLGKPGQGREILPFTALLMPAITAASKAQARLETRRAALQTLEAIRMHAAANHGRLPGSLDEIAVVPVPVDPASGKPFSYSLQGETAALDVVVATEYQTANWKFEITIRSSAER